MSIAGKGKTEVSTSSGKIKFDDVLYVPEVTKNLLSVGPIADGKERPKILFDSEKVWILKHFPLPVLEHIISEGIRDKKNDLYKFRPPNHSINSVETRGESETLALLWHYRLGHASLKVNLYMQTHSKV